MLLDIPTQIELRAGERNDPVETFLHFRWQVASRCQPLGFSANGVERLHEVSAPQFARIVGHGVLV